MGWRKVIGSFRPLVYRLAATTGRPDTVVRCMRPFDQRITVAMGRSGSITLLSGIGLPRICATRSVSSRPRMRPGSVGDTSGSEAVLRAAAAFVRLCDREPPPAASATEASPLPPACTVNGGRLAIYHLTVTAQVGTA